MDELKFQAGEQVRKVGGDYSFEGVVVAAFRKTSGKDRYVVEDDRGILHVFGPSNLEAVGTDLDEFYRRTGIPPGSSPSDASSHDKVASLLNRIARSHLEEEYKANADDAGEAVRILRMLGLDPSSALVVRLR